jgi:hypothetical protein
MTSGARPAFDAAGNTQLRQYKLEHRVAIVVLVEAVQCMAYRFEAIDFAEMLELGKVAKGRDYASCRL